MNIVNMPTLLKEINDSHREGTALIAWLRAICAQEMRHPNILKRRRSRAEKETVDMI